MSDSSQEFKSNQSTELGEVEAINHLKQAITSGKNWYLALLEAIGLWTMVKENRHNRSYQYLIDGEAFDLLLLAERLCEEVAGLIPEDERNELLFHGKPPVSLSAEEIKNLIGSSKYAQYLNYFYGIIAEEALSLAIQNEVRKERWTQGLNNENGVTDEACRRIYDETRKALLRKFRRQKGYPQPRSISLGELKAFIYWLFRYRLEHCDKSRVASDTKKALDWLKKQRVQDGFHLLLNKR
jgi:hypothetical protein